MGKSKKSKKVAVAKRCSFIAMLFGIVSVAMFFRPVIAIRDSEVVFTGIQVSLGYSEKFLGVNIIYFDFSILNLLTYALALCGVIFALLSCLGKGKGLTYFIALVSFVVSTILFFMQVAVCVPNNGLEKLVGGLGSLLGQKVSVKDSLALSYGAIIGGVASAIATVSLLAKKFIK